MRLATFMLVALAMVACTDLRDFQGEWTGRRIGDLPALRVGIAATASATLSIDGVDTHGLRGRLSVEGLMIDAPLVSIEGAEADVLASMSLPGAPIRVYLAFVPAPEGDVLAMIALYEKQRVELRLMRAGATPVYAIFALSERP